MVTANVQTIWIDLEKTDLRPDARPHDPEALELLTHDMEKQGQLQEIIVESRAGRYEVIAGVGRTLAARKLGWKQIRASVREGVSEFDKARITFAENEDREEVDAFYQAYQLKKMVEAKGSSQQALAKELGISDGLMSAYLAVDRLPEIIKQTFRRLKLGQLTQIARLSKAETQIGLAEKCAKQDLSVRQAKAIVNRILKIGKAASRPGERGRESVELELDPLAADWEKLQDKTKGWIWSADYQQNLVWQFTVNLEAMHPQNNKKAIGQWFLKMAEVLGETKEDGKVQEQIEKVSQAHDMYGGIIKRATQKMEGKATPAHSNEEKAQDVAAQILQQLAEGKVPDEKLYDPATWEKKKP